MSNITDNRATPFKILIAEDSPTQARRLQYILEQSGYQVSVAENGRRALAMASDIRPALVISDVNMPEMNGYDLTRCIKADPQLRSTPMILVTSMSDPEDVILGLQCGADNFVLKPFEEGYLLDCVGYAIANRDALDDHKSGKVDDSVDISYNGTQHQITATRTQILNLLLSTYGAAIQRNKQLIAGEEALRKRTSELVMANRFLDSVIESDPNMIFIKEAQTLRFTRVNRACEQILGISREELLGKSDYDFFPRTQADAFVAKDREVLAQRVASEVHEEPINTRERGQRLLHTKKVPLIDEDGTCRHMLGISEDVTEQRALERMVKELNKSLAEHVSRLEASNRNLESFSYSASHDLRSPLNVIGGYVGLLEKQYASQLDEKAMHYLGVIRKNTLQMSKLIDDLLAFSRASDRIVQRVDMDMNQTVQKIVADLLQLHAQDKKPVIELSPLPSAKADVGLLSQVWVNLLSNAIKYSSKSLLPKVQVRGQLQGEEIIYSVADNGVGFDMDQHDKLFGIFQRLPGSEEFDGTGIGLAIVHRIVTHHGGRVWAEGKRNEGAVFHFALPVLS